MKNDERALQGSSASSFLALYFHPSIIAIFFLGFSSGLPLALTASTLSAWLTEDKVDLATIGLFAAVTTPYALKFLWSPVIDGMSFPFLSRLLGRRRGWLIATQLALIVSITLLGITDPVKTPWLTWLVSFLVVFFSASQDIVVDAYRIEILKPEQYGAGAAMVVLGYRIGMTASKAGALMLATYVSWSATYTVMAALIGVGIVTVLLSREPEASAEKEVNRPEKGTIGDWLSDHVVAPFSDFMTRPHWLAILLFILLYRLADAFMGLMPTAFYLELGFTMKQVAGIAQFYGMIATIAGGFIGGVIVARLGMIRSLWVCGIAHALTNLMFVVQAKIGADMHVLALAITLENVTGGMGTTAFVAFISTLTHTRFTATQYALLSSFASFGRTWLSTPGGWLAEKMGWPAFFTLAASLALPGLAVLWWLNKRLTNNDNNPSGLADSKASALAAQK